MQTPWTSRILKISLKEVCQHTVGSGSTRSLVYPPWMQIPLSHHCSSEIAELGVTVWFLCWSWWFFSYDTQSFCWFVWVPSEAGSDTKIQEQYLNRKVTLGREWSQGSRSWLWAGGLSPASEPVGQCGPSLRALPPRDCCGHPYSSLNGDCSQDTDLQVFTDCPSWTKQTPLAHTALGRWNHRPASDGMRAREDGQRNSPRWCLSFVFTLVLQWTIIILVLHSSFHLTKNYHKPDVFALETPHFSLQTIFVSLFFLNCILLVHF